MTPEQWTALKFGQSIHMGASSFQPWADYEGGAVQPASVINYADLNFERWFDAGQKAGAEAFMLTTKYPDGLFLKPSNATPWNTTNIPWGKANPDKADIVRMFTRECRARGKALGYYISVWDNYFDSIVSALDYTEWTLACFEELFHPDAYDPAIDFCFIDGWGEPRWTPKTFSNPVYATVIAAIREWQPNMLVFVNSYVMGSGDGSKGDGGIWERPAMGTDVDLEDIPAFPCWLFHDPLDPDGVGGYIGRWFDHDDAPANTPEHLRAFINRRYVVNGLGLHYHVNYSIGPSGRLADDSVEMVAEFFDPPGTLVARENFLTGTDDQTNLSALPDWDKTVGAEVNVEPSGDCWTNGFGIHVFKRQAVDVGRCELDFHFREEIDNPITLQIMLHATDAADQDDHVAFNRNGDGAGLSLGYYNGSNNQTDAPSFAANLLQTDTKYRLIFSDNGVKARGWLQVETADGTMQTMYKAMGASSGQTGGWPGIFHYSPAATAESGLHITDFRIYEPNTTKPLPSTLSIVGDEISMKRFGKANQTKLYRSENGGATWELAYLGPASRFRDPLWTVGNSYAYRAKDIDPDWNESEVFGNRIDVTAADSGLLEKIYKAARTK